MEKENESVLENTSTGEERELCLQCLAENQPDVPFCHSCAAPLSSYAATGPFESIFAEGHLYRRAAEQPHRPITVLGVWIIFSAFAFTGGFMARNSFGSILQILLGIGMIILAITVIARTTINYLSREETQDS